MKLFSNFPSEKVIFKTQLSKEEVLEKLNQNVEYSELNIIDFKTYTKPYKGKINGNLFEINRVISYRNSFLPQIKGEVRQSINGTEIEVKMSIHLIILVFMMVWLLGVFFAFLATLVACILNDISFFPLIIPIVMFMIGVGIAYLGFTYETKKVKDDFKTIFSAKII